MNNRQQAREEALFVLLMEQVARQQDRQARQLGRALEEDPEAALSPALQETTAATILKNDLSVRQTEQLVKKLTAGKKEKPSPAGLTVDYAQEAARDLGNTLGRGCRIVSGKKKGRIELEYYGVDDLNELLEALHTIKKP